MRCDDKLLFQRTMLSTRPTCRIGVKMATIRLISSLLSLSFVLIPSFCVAQEFNEVRFWDVVAKMEQDVNALAAHVELLYQERCQVSPMCEYGNFLDCVSTFPGATCHGGDNLYVPECGGRTSCNTLYDYTSSSVRVPQEYLISSTSTFSSTDTWNDNTTASGNGDVHPSIVPALCWTRPLDDWFINKYSNDLNYWNELGESPRSMYYGDATTGLFRIYPARQAKDETCLKYDPRLRPWYIAGSSGPKNVLLVLDISGSMKDLPLEQLKDAATRIIDTLTVRDRVNIVVFHTTARLLDPVQFPELAPATDDNKKLFTAAINALAVGNQTNFLDAFGVAFDVLDASVTIEQHVCASSRQSNTALIFFTDGLMNIPSYDTDPVVQLVNERIAALSDHLNIVLLAYSVAGASNDDTDIHIFPSQLACAVPQGVWSKISTGRQIPDSLASYHELFALGLANANFTAWVDPYKFSTGDILGITVSVPTYDRSVQPPRFLGVAAMDFGLTALVTALGGSSTTDIEFVRDGVIERLAQESTSRCPRLALDSCELETYRRWQGSNCSASIYCNDTFTTSTGNTSSEETDPTLADDGTATSILAARDISKGASCDISVVYPRYVLNNTNNTDLTFEQRTCCAAPQSTLLNESSVDSSSEQCPHAVSVPTLTEAAPTSTDSNPTASPPTTETARSSSPLPLFSYFVSLSWCLGLFSEVLS